MAKLYDCKACGHQVHGSAKRCPSCDARDPSGSDARFVIWFGGIVIGLVMMGALSSREAEVPHRYDTLPDTTADGFIVLSRYEHPTAGRIHAVSMPDGATIEDARAHGNSLPNHPGGAVSAYYYGDGGELPEFNLSDAASWYDALVMLDRGVQHRFVYMRFSSGDVDVADCLTDSADDLCIDQVP